MLATQTRYGARRGTPFLGTRGASRLGLALLANFANSQPRQELHLGRRKATGGDGKKPGVRSGTPRWRASGVPADVQTWSLNFSPPPTFTPRPEAKSWCGTWPAVTPRRASARSACGRRNFPGRSLRGHGGIRSWVRLWDGRSFQLRRVLRGHADEQCTAFTPDSPASGGKDTTVLLWSLASARLISHCPTGVESSFSPDGKRGHVEARTIRTIDRLEVAGRSVVAVLTNSLIVGFSPDGTCLLARGQAAFEWVSLQREAIERTVS